MARSQAQTKEVQELINTGKSECYWLGDNLEAIVSTISSLDLELLGGGRYLFVKSNDSLQISEESKGISRYKINNNAADVEIDSNSINIRLAGIKGISKVVLLRDPKSIPTNARSFTHLDGPVDLLEEFAELHAKRKSGTLTEQERERQSKLVELIGKGYQQTKSQIPSSRSTPAGYGESRSTSGYSFGG